jgi:ubiquinone/menaquinone biosynthesis C-methylase UbiE
VTADGSHRPERIPFDRIATDYDRTRSLPPSTMSKVVSLLTGELLGRGRCLEIGVGTGRLAVPLSEAGVSMAGVDLSGPMLARLRQKLAPGRTLPVARADATSLPFADGTMGSVLAAHVLHLISGWKTALSEAVRVVRKGGVIVADVGNCGGRGVWAALRDRFCAEAGIERPFPGPSDPHLVDALMASLGASLRTLAPVIASSAMTAEGRIAAMEQGVYSFTWQLDGDARRTAAARTRAWAAQRWSLEEPRRHRRRIVLRAYDV